MSIDGGSALPAASIPSAAAAFSLRTATTPTNAGALQRMDGLRFDAGFNADHFLTFDARL